ncbi:MAG: tRNA (adenosine(37)-N6)-threonylcarbamoyltransferase complex ATPase subunit type 1 TsaE [Prolixibacteraceae bacterium]|nr:tRNA (adenosine(37)-N6)-threonylcarbamoyltransferase complex ATPase subunit type 1 TsaE [Prolixibacteraceae bacterium]
MDSILIDNLSALPSAAGSFIKKMNGRSVFAFYGEMGAGKTTFIKEVCQQLGVNENITSPSFALVNEYISSSGESIYHFDCYRLKGPEEAIDIGAEEYFYSGNLCFIEWPERIEDLLPPETVEVHITVDNNKRTITLH